MHFGKVLVMSAGVLAALPSTAWGQRAPVSRSVPITYVGVVTNAANDTIIVRKPDGSMAPYTGPLPDLPYARGDQVTISFNAELPTRAYVDDYLAMKGVPPSADGQYRIQVSPCYYSGCTDPVGALTALKTTGPLMPEQNFGQPTNVRMTVVYDYNNDSYSIDWGANATYGDFVAGSFGTPGYLYDPQTGQYVACANAQACRGSAAADPVIFGLKEADNGTSLTSGPIRINSLGTGTSGTGLGSFFLSFLGSWSLPAFGAGEPAEVPEPGMMLLFGAAAAVLPLRRRMRRAA